MSENAATGLAHHVARFDIAMKQACCMYGAHGAADINPDQRGFRGAEGAVGAANRRERLAVDKVAPKADASIKAIDAVDGNDIHVADTGDGASFPQQCARFGFGVLRREAAAA
ncbi:MAG: hypothetical protein QM767_28210 [Anaeromyxobacter sp.]